METIIRSMMRCTTYTSIDNRVKLRVIIDCYNFEKLSIVDLIEFSISIIVSRLFKRSHGRRATLFRGDPFFRDDSIETTGLARPRHGHRAVHSMIKTSRKGGNDKVWEEKYFFFFFQENSDMDRIRLEYMIIFWHDKNGAPVVINIVFQSWIRFSWIRCACRVLFARRRGSVRVILERVESNIGVGNVRATFYSHPRARRIDESIGIGGGKKWEKDSSSLHVDRSMRGAHCLQQTCLANGLNEKLLE